MNLVFIHGRGQQERSAAELELIWTRAWELGLKKNNLSIPESTTIIFPFYGDKLIELIQAKEDNRERSKGFNDEPLPRFMLEIIRELDDHMMSTDSEYAKQYLEQEISKGPMNWEWFQSVLRRLDNTWLGDFSLSVFTKDAYHYLDDKKIQHEVNDLVRGCMNNEPCVVVGHSLGSAVGYQIFQENPALYIKKYITVGSPLGLTSFQKRLYDKSMPTCVHAWYNALDEGDGVALHLLDEHHFNVQPSIENYNGVHNHTKNKHGIEGYLDDKEVARVIYEALIG
jgi:hypothetical protein